MFVKAMRWFQMVFSDRQEAELDPDIEIEGVFGCWLVLPVLGCGGPTKVR
jgi:hypothetical protein